MPSAHLADRGVVKVVGEEARGFLQGLVTADMAKVSPATALFAALLAPQGKILVDFIIAEAEPADGGGFFLDCPAALAPDLMRRLNLYKLRARVIVEDLTEVLGIVAYWGGSAPDPDEGLAFADPRLPAFGHRLIAERRRAAALGDAAAEAWHAHRIGLGVPEGGKDFSYGDTFPHEALMDGLGGVDFKKGCFVGQEVVSRMEHRGSGGRTRIVPVRYEGGFGPVDGAEVMAGERAIGHTGSRAGGIGLAKLRLDKLADALAAGETVRAGGIALVAMKPDWAGFSVPGA